MSILSDHVHVADFLHVQSEISMFYKQGFQREPGCLKARKVFIFQHVRVT